VSDKSKIGIGAIIVFLGLAALFYAMPIVARMVSTNGPVFKETDVPNHPPGVMMYIPIEIAGVGALIVGTSFMGYGLAQEPSTAARRYLSKTDRKTGMADAA
jgi:hypothetical protein